MGIKNSKMFDEVKKVIDEWDPIGLLCAHCPPDEYDDISMMLSEVLNCNMSVEFVAREIYTLFIQAFDSSTFNKGSDECISIARKIVESMPDINMQKH